MDTAGQNEIYAQQWKKEREEKQNYFLLEIQSLKLSNPIACLSFEDSDSFQMKSDEWPDKYRKPLYYQIELENFDEVTTIMKSYFKNIQTDFTYIFLMNLNFGLVKITKQDLLTHWKDILDIDKDEFFCHNPLNGDFINIERTQDFIIGLEPQGRKWIYEITISNEVLMNTIKNCI